MLKKRFFIIFFLALLSLKNAATISSCVSINAPGSYNVLNDITFNTSLINTSCIEVNAPNVVIDCQGHRLKINFTGSSGSFGDYVAFIEVRNENVSIENCIFEGSQAWIDYYTPNSGDLFDSGVIFFNNSYGALRNNTFNRTSLKSWASSNGWIVVENNSFINSQIKIINNPNFLIEKNVFLVNDKINGTHLPGSTSKSVDLGFLFDFRFTDYNRTIKVVNNTFLLDYGQNMDRFWFMEHVRNLHVENNTFTTNGKSQHYIWFYELISSPGENKNITFANNSFLSLYPLTMRMFGDLFFIKGNYFENVSLNFGGTNSEISSNVFNNPVSWSSLIVTEESSDAPIGPTANLTVKDNIFNAVGGYDVVFIGDSNRVCYNITVINNTDPNGGEILFFGPNDSNNSFDLSFQRTPEIIVCHAKNITLKNVYVEKLPHSTSIPSDWAMKSADPITQNGIYALNSTLKVENYIAKNVHAAVKIPHSKFSIPITSGPGFSLDQGIILTGNISIENASFSVLSSSAPVIVTNANLDIKHSDILDLDFFYFVPYTPFQDKGFYVGVNSSFMINSSNLSITGGKIKLYNTIGKILNSNITFHNVNVSSAREDQGILLSSFEYILIPPFSDNAYLRVENSSVCSDGFNELPNDGKLFTQGSHLIRVYTSSNENNESRIDILNSEFCAKPYAVESALTIRDAPNVYVFVYNSSFSNFFSVFNSNSKNITLEIINSTIEKSFIGINVSNITNVIFENSSVNESNAFIYSKEQEGLLKVYNSSFYSNFVCNNFAPPWWWGVPNYMDFSSTHNLTVEIFENDFLDVANTFSFQSISDSPAKPLPSTVTLKGNKFDFNKSFISCYIEGRYMSIWPNRFFYFTNAFLQSGYFLEYNDTYGNIFGQLGVYQIYPQSANIFVTNITVRNYSHRFGGNPFIYLNGEIRNVSFKNIMTDNMVNHTFLTAYLNTYPNERALLVDNVSVNRSIGQTWDIFIRLYSSSGQFNSEIRNVRLYNHSYRSMEIMSFSANLGNNLTIKNVFINHPKPYIDGMINYTSPKDPIIEFPSNPLVLFQENYMPILHTYPYQPNSDILIKALSSFIIDNLTVNGVPEYYYFIHPNISEKAVIPLSVVYGDNYSLANINLNRSYIGIYLHSVIRGNLSNISTYADIPLYVHHCANISADNLTNYNSSVKVYYIQGNSTIENLTANSLVICSNNGNISLSNITLTSENHSGSILISSGFYDRFGYIPYSEPTNLTLSISNINVENTSSFLISPTFISPPGKDAHLSIKLENVSVNNTKYTSVYTIPIDYYPPSANSTFSLDVDSSNFSGSAVLLALGTWGFDSLTLRGSSLSNATHAIYPSSLENITVDSSKGKGFATFLPLYTYENASFQMSNSSISNAYRVYLLATYPNSQANIKVNESSFRNITLFLSSTIQRLYFSLTTDINLSLSNVYFKNLSVFEYTYLPRGNMIRVLTNLSNVSFYSNNSGIKVEDAQFNYSLTSGQKNVTYVFDNAPFLPFDFIPISDVANRDIYLGDGIISVNTSAEPSLLTPGELIFKTSSCTISPILKNLPNYTESKSTVLSAGTVISKPYSCVYDNVLSSFTIRFSVDDFLDG